MSDHSYHTPPGQQPRRRRSQRAQQGNANPYRPPQAPAYQPDEERAPLPLGAEHHSQPQGRQRPQSYDYEAYAPQGPGGAADPGYYDEDEYAPRLWPKLLLGLLILILAAAALYFFVPKDSPGPLGTARSAVATVVDAGLGLVGIREEKPPLLIKFESPVQESGLGMKTVFTFTADSPIDGVRIVDEEGNDLKGQLAMVDPERTVWTLALVFDQPMHGLLRADMLRGDTWYLSDKTILFAVIEPTPSPEPLAAQLPAFDPSATMPPQPGAEEPGEEQLAANNPANGGQQEAFVVTATQPAPVLTLQPTQPPPVTVITIAPRPAAAQPTEAPALAGADAASQVSDIQEGADSYSDLPEELPGMDELPPMEGDLPPVEAAEEEQMPAEPTAVPAPQTPAPSPMPLLTAQADVGTEPGKLRLAEIVYVKAKRTNELKRDIALNMPAPHEYATYEGGVFTFRNDGFRGNAAAGSPEMPLQQLSVLWKAPLGSLRTKSDTLYGMGWTGQPAIIRWSKELREWMNITPAKKDVTALKEVIAASQDGKIYFFDLNDGVATREPIDLGYPMKGSVSLDPRGQPLLAVGQGISNMPSGTKPIGFYLYELIKQEQIYFLNGRRTKIQQQFSTNGAFDGTALFERNSDTLVLSGENGLLYTLALNTTFDYLDTRSLKVNPVITYQRAKGANQADMAVTSEASVAMYGKYIYTADRHGFLRCVDSDSMKSVWAFDTGDNTDATPALGFDEDGSLGLYTGTTVFTRTRGKGQAFIRRLDALTGKEMWQVQVPAKFENTERGGVKASPVVGEGAARDLVFFTVNMTNDGKSATLLALNKQTGEQHWQLELDNRSVSSPVAVYNKQGQAFIIQADETGILYLLDALTGEELHRLELGASIEASPAVYNDVLVIGSNDKDNNFLYGIRLE